MRIIWQKRAIRLTSLLFRCQFYRNVQIAKLVAGAAVVTVNVKVLDILYKINLPMVSH